MSIDQGFGDDLSGFSMLELFRMEAQAQARVLTDGLLRSERGQDPATLEAMMRAAHSTKGAAAIVGMEPMVKLAHAMEDVFIAAQQGRLALDAAGVDVLLEAVDLMRHLAALSEAELIDAGPHRGRVEAALAALDALQAGAREAPAVMPLAPIAAQVPAAVPAAVPTASAPAPAPLPAAAPPLDPGNELLTLAGQARLHAGQLRPWIDALQRHKRQQHGMFAALEQLREAIVAGGDPRLLELARVVDERARPLRDSLQRSILDAEHYERQATGVATRLVDEVLELHMCRFGDGLHGLPRMVRDLARSLGKDVRLDVTGADTLVDRAVLVRLEAPLGQLLRNAVDHGMEPPAERAAAGKPATGTIRLEARHRGGMLSIEVSDDGRGVDPERIRRAAVARRLAAPGFAQALSRPELMEFLFLPGFSLKEDANEISGRGVGLDVVHEAVQAQNGTVRVESTLGRGFRTAIVLPVTQSIVRALVVDVLGEPYALPIARAERVLRVPAGAVQTLAGRQYLEVEGVHLGLVAAGRVLELGDATPGAELAVVVIGGARERYGLVVDEVRGEQSLTVQPLDPVFGKLRDVASCALLDDGAPVLILDVPDMLLSIARLLETGESLQPVPAGAGARQDGRQAARRILVVDDSLTVREMQRKLLAARGYRVDVALDGVDGWNSVRAGAYDLVITDIDMPRMDGIRLLERIRQDPRLQRLPVMIVSYKDRPEDRARGLEAGADYYLAKGAFHDATLLDAVRDLIGGPLPGEGS
ncbi:hybrid sensor histidine kinase/response regulator [Massilia sp. 2TAF26]|uniref:hybrid sensor histidine kinase/response regulator n=1 Tax=Massilia sp. 2TAF26 TaxID=3233012 RepID=UPI003F9DCB8B